jgi:putative copper resistance protein D
LTTLIDLFGFVSVVLHGLDLVAQTALVGSVAFVVFVADPLHRADNEPKLLDVGAAGRRVLEAAAFAAVVTVTASTALNAIVLAVSLGVSWREVVGSAFVIAGAVKALAALGTGVVAAIGPRQAPWTRVALAVGATAVLCAAVATSHAVARLDESGVLAFATGAHELGAALWLGGLPCFWLALRRGDSPQTASWIGRRYSTLAASGVALIAGGAMVFAIVYIGSVAAVYGTAYGAMAVVKSVLFAALLLLGLANFRAVRRFAADSAAMPRVRNFVVVEMGIGFAVLMAAASITSLPPGVDLVEDRVTLSDIAARTAPAWPRLASPDHAALALPALQAQLDADAQAAATASRAQAFVPGSGTAPPRNAYDIAWSEYNHHWAGLLVAAMGFAALARKSGRASWAQHWPLLFLLLAAFLFVRADPEVWPMGEIGLFQSLKDPEVAQHRLFETLIVAFALFEWRVTTGRIASRPSMRVFPLLVALGGTLLVTHSHALGNVKEEFLIELTHLPIAVLGIIAGWARWLEVEAPGTEGHWAGWLWPICFVLIGCLLVAYREA